MQFSTIACLLMLASTTTYAKANDEPRIPVTQIQLTGTRYANNQAHTPEQAVLDVKATETLLLSADGRYRSETLSVYPGDIRFNLLEVGSESGSAIADMIGWRTGSELTRQSGERARIKFADLSFLNPQALLNNVNVAIANQESISIQDAANRPATLFFDTTTQTIQRAVSATFTYWYSEYVQHQSTLVPTRIEVKLGDRLIARWSVTLQQTSATPQQFELPQGFIEPTPKGALHVNKLSEHIYRIDGSESNYHMAFAVGKNHVVLFDAPVNKDEAGKFKALVKQTANGKPITRIIVSHTHADHIAGLAAYANEDVRILTGKNGRIALQRIVGDALANKVEEIDHNTQIDLGDETLSVVAHNSTHATDMLVSYANHARIVFQGDLFMMPEIGPVPPSFPISWELDNLIKHHQWQPNYIISVHGRAATWDDLKLSLKRRYQANH